MFADTDKDVRARAPRELSPVEPHLFVVFEGARPQAGGLRCSLAGVHEVELGRGEARTADRDADGARLVVTLPDRKVSSRHARLKLERGVWRIEDEASTNGTFVNGRRVPAQLLADGDVIEIGHSVLRIRTDVATPSQTADMQDAGGVAPGPLALGTLLPVLAAELDLLARAARAAIPVLLLGETGTGKEVTARAVHAASGRTGELVPVNCAALPDSLVEAQLFGHVKGAFSGAVRDEVGFVRRAHGGTIFLDEIGDLPRAAQGALLRVLQEGEVVPVGATRPVGVDVRVIAATHQPIEAMVERGEFRRDLYARLRGFTHRLWTLAARREDLGLLIAAWLKQGGEGRAKNLCLTSEASRALLSHSWPLNVRELVQALTHALALSDDGIIDVAHWPPSLARVAPRGGTPASATHSSPRDSALRAQLMAALEHRAGNVAAVARDMQKAPMQIYRWMQRLGIDPHGFRR